MKPISELRWITAKRFAQHARWNQEYILELLEEGTDSTGINFIFSERGFSVFKAYQEFPVFALLSVMNFFRGMLNEIK